VSNWILSLAIVAATLVCPALMWLGRRGIGPGCAICPPRRDDEQSLDHLRIRQQELTTKIDRLESRRA
jgi:hypothetical protein